MVVSTKMAAFWVVALCSLVEVYQRFRGPCASIIRAMVSPLSSTGSRASPNPDPVPHWSGQGFCLGWLVPISQTDSMCAAYSSPWWWRQQGSLKRWLTSTRLHGATTQKTAIFVWQDIQVVTDYKLRYECDNNLVCFFMAQSFSRWYRETDIRNSQTPLEHHSLSTTNTGVKAGMVVN
jgi:hypothetical protein